MYMASGGQLSLWRQNNKLALVTSELTHVFMFSPVISGLTRACLLMAFHSCVVNALQLEGSGH